MARLTVESGRVVEMVAAFLRPYVERHIRSDTKGEFETRVFGSLESHHSPLR